MPGSPVTVMPALVGHFKEVPIAVCDTGIDAVLVCQPVGVDTAGDVDAVRRVCAPDRPFGTVTHRAGV